ncbi:MAG: LacI family DNA-binding transcriptional regulator [Victivallales bacterium]|nr:LacI family DNA-binding transcriptional regulator [Victivallales bacterium]
MDNHVTIMDVARAAGVSKGVVSAVLSGRGGTIRVSAARRAAVEQAARRLDYKPNLMARSLLSRKSYLLAYLCPGGGGTWGVSTRLLRGLQRSALRRGYSLVVYPSDSLESERENIRAALARQVDGMLVSPLMLDMESNISEYHRLLSEGLPLVQIGMICAGLPTVMRDYRACAREGVHRLLERGFRRVAFVVHSNYVDPLTGPASHAMFLGYQEGMAEAGLPCEIVPVNVDSVRCASTQAYKAMALEVAHDAFAQHLNAHAAPDAVLATNHNLAYGVGLALRERGVAAPEDVPIISCSDDYVLPSLVFPQLSGFPIDGEALSEAAIALCLGETSAAQPILVPQPYVERESFRSLPCPAKGVSK